MDTTSIISLLAFGLSLATFIVLRLNRRDEIADEQTDADSRTAALARKAVAARLEAGGNSQAVGDRNAKRMALTHSGTGL